VRQKLIVLAVGVLVASLLALPATAGPGRPGGKHAIPAACKQAATDAAKTFHQSQRDARKTFHQQLKAARAAFRHQTPRPTRDQFKAFVTQQHADLKTFVQGQRDANKTFRQGQVASLKSCAA
jgi:hypothetical protein